MSGVESSVYRFIDRFIDLKQISFALYVFFHVNEVLEGITRQAPYLDCVKSVPYLPF